MNCSSRKSVENSASDSNMFWCCFFYSNQHVPENWICISVNTHRSCWCNNSGLLCRRYSLKTFVCNWIQNTFKNKIVGGPLYFSLLWIEKEQKISYLKGWNTLDDDGSLWVTEWSKKSRASRILVKPLKLGKKFVLLSLFLKESMSC